MRGSTSGQGKRVVKNSVNAELLALLNVLLDKGLISEEDIGRVGDVAALIKLMVSHGLFTAEDLQDRKVEVEQIVSRVVGVVRSGNVAARKALIKDIETKYPKKYRRLLEFFKST